MGKFTKTLTPGNRVEEKFTNIQGEKVTRTSGVVNTTRTKSGPQTQKSRPTQTVKDSKRK